MLVVSIEKEPEQRKSPGVKQRAGSCIPLSKKNFTGLIMHMLARHLITVHVGCQGHFAKISECANLLLIGFPCWLKCFFFVHYEEHILGWPMNKCHTTVYFSVSKVSFDIFFFGQLTEKYCLIHIKLKKNKKNKDKQIINFSTFATAMLQIK